MSEMEAAIIGALKLREKHGRHMHHSQCIHNLTPAEQVEMRGKTVEWWQKVIGSMPIQITPADWEIEAPNLLKEPSHD
jgi:hypothetical protein